MNINNINISVGLDNPIKIAHITDVHISLADGRNPNLIDHAKYRADVFREEAGNIPKAPETCFKESIEYAERNCDITVITGDVIDFCSAANLDASDRVLNGKNYMFAAGNHEFCPEVGIPDSFARKHDLLKEIQSHYNGNMEFDSKIIGGLNIATMDNGYYCFNRFQIESLKAEIKKGYPIIIFTHVPLSDPIMQMNSFHKDLMPDEYMKAINNEMLDLIYNCSLIKAAFSGHTHKYSVSTLNGGKPEYVTAGNFKDTFCVIEIN